MRAILRTAVIVGLLAAVAGCIGTSEEIFGPDAAAVVPGIEGSYTQQGGDQDDVVTVEAISGTRDYAYFNPKDRERDRGRMRAVSFGNEMYVLQMRDDTWPQGRYWQLLLRVVRQNGSIKSVVVLWPEDDAVAALAVEDGIELGPPGEGDAFGPKTLKGSRAAIAAFLKSLASLPLREVATYVRN
jgi:hypothetical protein